MELRMSPHTLEELYNMNTDHNIKIVAQALTNIIHILCHVHGAENAYIRELGRDLNNKYGLELEAITNSDNDCDSEAE